MSEDVGLIHPAFASAAAVAATKPLCEGPLASGDAGETYNATEDGVSLSVRLTKGERNQWNVAEARHNGATSDQLRGVLDVFCQVVGGLPLQEAADHGAIHALERLRGNPLVRPVAGILTPRSSGTAFICCERLMRSVASQHATKTGDHGTANFWNPVISSTWRSKSDAERIEALLPIMVAFRACHGLAADDLSITAIEKTRRVIVGFGPDVDYIRKPQLIMQLEVEIRRATGDRLELFMTEVKDSNEIRRLASTEEPT